jgi:hypothetical protein
VEEAERLARTVEEPPQHGDLARAVTGGSERVERGVVAGRIGRHLAKPRVPS